MYKRENDTSLSAQVNQEKGGCGNAEKGDAPGQLFKPAEKIDRLFSSILSAMRSAMAFS
jgi:hypothetical protein